MSRKLPPKIIKEHFEKGKNKYHWDLAWIIWGKVSRIRGRDLRDSDGKVIEIIECKEDESTGSL